MLDIYSDLTLQQATYGGHLELLEVDELSALRREVNSGEVDARVELFSEEFDIQPDCPEQALKEAARTSVALDRLVERYKLGSLAYYYKGSGIKENGQTISTIARSG